MAIETQLKERLTEKIGEAAISTDSEILRDFSTCLGPVPDGNPIMIVRPKSPEEIQGIVRSANEMGLNLVTSASGVPRFKGATIPSGEGVIVDLSEMRQILHIDRRNKMAIIEPGVTFGQLKTAVARQGMKVLMPLLPKSSKSVLGSYLDREPITIPKYHWDMTDPLLCTELVFGTGDFFRTGAASGPGSLEGMLKSGLGLKNPMGPASTDIVRLVQGAQGTLGIVTWASVKLEVLPTIRKCYFASDIRLERLVDFTFPAMRRRMPDEFFVVNAAALARMLSTEPDEIKTLAAQQAPFTAIYCLAGYNDLPEKRVEYLERDMMDVALATGAKIVKEIPGTSRKEMAALIDAPSGEPHWKLRGEGGVLEIFFLTTLDRAPLYMDLMEWLLEQNDFPQTGLGLYIQPIQQGRACHMEFHLYFDPSDKKSSGKAEKIFQTASQELADKHAFFSRPHGPWADIAYARCPDSVRALREMKRIFDPNGVLNRGKLCFGEGA